MSEENKNGQEEMKFDYEEAEEYNAFVGFFVKHGKIIGNLLLNHIAMCVFGLIVIIACNLLSNQVFGGSDVLQHIGGTFSALFYLVLIYINMWEKGASDKIKKDGGRLKTNKLYGLLVWAVANSLFILLTILTTIFSFCWLDGASFVNIVLNFTNGMYLNLLNVIPAPWCYLVILVPGALTAIFSYLSGLAGHRCLFPEKKPKDKN